LGELEDGFTSIRKPAVIDYKELGAFQTRGHGSAHMAYIF
jgi:hypothetical protein